MLGHATRDGRLRQQLLCQRLRRCGGERRCVIGGGYILPAWLADCDGPRQVGIAGVAPARAAAPAVAAVRTVAGSTRHCIRYALRAAPVPQQNLCALSPFPLFFPLVRQEGFGVFLELQRSSTA
jgi:hypothetical protein